MPSRFDIPDIPGAVNALEVSELCYAIDAYSVQLKQAMDNRDYCKMVAAGQVLVSLTRRNSAELAGKSARIRAKAVNKMLRF